MEKISTTIPVIDYTTAFFTAAVMGTKAFHAGLVCAPCVDKELEKLVYTNGFDHAQRCALMTAWTDNWHMANANQPFKD
ncbi:hypothetical protein [Spirosoma sp.]|uniref:hypothetical protein n=1 Tax=Spirosoma sp. TaxID=1899569 RepID=UPI0026208C73|nr:hypothetical protein [Spirosoma sp.]MCX6217666.1 hypothetical protein [Spirosoma sp.]